MKSSSFGLALLAGSALSLVAGAASAQQVNGGGSTLASPTYESAFNLYVNVNPNADFGDTYTPSGSGAAQTALLTNTINATGAQLPFEFAASDATLNEPTQLYGASGWNNIGTGKSQAGLLVEVPTIGTPITIPVNLSGVGANGFVNFSNADLCGIFSGKLKQWSEITDANLPANEGNIEVIYRADGSGTSFLLTQHLAAVCTSANSSITFTATTMFSALFPSGVPSNFSSSANNTKNLTGSPGLQYVLATTPSSVGYLSPDYTKIIASPTNPSTAPYVANVGGVSPTPANTSAALATGKPAVDTVVNPASTPYNVADPNSFIPVAAVPTTGYPIVGYTTVLMAQCYAAPGVAGALRGFLNQFYTSATFRALENSNGFAALPSPTLTNRIISTYLTASAANAINDAGTGACAGLTGR